MCALASAPTPRNPLPHARRARPSRARRAAFSRFAGGKLVVSHGGAYAQRLLFDAYSALGHQTIPFTLKFAREPAQSDLLAVADEEGSMTLLRVTAGEHGADAVSQRWEAHHNAIFDLAWVASDARLITAGGDQQCHVWDVERRLSTASARGHVGSVKSVSAKPGQPEVFASGSRDGSVMVWDCRSARADGTLAAVSVMRNAHAAPAASGRKRKRLTGHQSVTSVQFLRWENMLATGGAADGCAPRSHGAMRAGPPPAPRSAPSPRPPPRRDEAAPHRRAPAPAPARPSARDRPSRSAVKLWDLRQLAEPRELLSVDLQPQGPGPDGRPSRARGVCNLDLDESGLQLLCATTGGRAHVLDLLRPERGAVATFSGHASETFYVKACFSPDGQYVCSGSSDKNAYVWHAAQPALPALQLVGHGGEVTAVDWCRSVPCAHARMVATCSDDGTVRVWGREGHGPRTFVTPARARSRQVPRAEAADDAHAASTPPARTAGATPPEAAASAARTGLAPLARTRTIEDFWPGESREQDAGSAGPREIQ